MTLPYLQRNPPVHLISCSVSASGGLCEGVHKTTYAYQDCEQHCGQYETIGALLSYDLAVLGRSAMAHLLIVNNFTERVQRSVANFGGSNLNLKFSRKSWKASIAHNMFGLLFCQCSMMLAVNCHVDDLSLRNPANIFRYARSPQTVRDNIKVFRLAVLSSCMLSACLITCEGIPPDAIITYRDLKCCFARIIG